MLKLNDINDRNILVTSPSQQFVLLYDEDCYLCKMLAQIAARKLSSSNIRCESWQKYKNTPEAQQLLPQDILSKDADKLRLICPNGLKEGKEVWLWLLETYPDLKTLGWLASKLGLSNLTVSFFYYGSTSIRKMFCFKCRTR